MYEGRVNKTLVPLLCDGKCIVPPTPKCTVLSLVKFVPVKVICVPTDAVIGEIEVRLTVLLTVAFVDVIWNGTEFDVPPTLFVTDTLYVPNPIG